MKYYHSQQNTKFDVGLSNVSGQEIDGFLYFTIDLGIRGQQLWKTDGINTVLVAKI